VVASAAALRVGAAPLAQLARDFALEVSARVLPRTAAVRPGAEELADELRVRRVLRLVVHGDPAPGEITRLVEALAREPEAVAHEGGRRCCALRSARDRGCAPYTGSTVRLSERRRNAFPRTHRRAVRRLPS
jgi:hypothetical protein